MMHGFLDNTHCFFLCLVEYFTQMLNPLCFNVSPYVKKNILLFIREHFKTNWIERFITPNVFLVPNLTCWVAAQRSKSSIDQIDMEFKSETRSHCKV